MRQTYTHKLASGLEIEFKRMMSIHQEWLSQGKSRSSTKTKTNKSDKNIDDVLADITVRIGSKSLENLRHEEKLKYIGELLSPCFKEALMAARFFSVDRHFAERQVEYSAYLDELKKWQLKRDFEEGILSKEQLKAQGVDELELQEISEEKPEYKSELPEHIFTFSYTWKDKDEDGNIIELSEKYELPVHFHEFKFRAPKTLFTELPTSEEKVFELELPIAGSKVRYNMLDVKMENMNKGRLDSETIHINSPIQWRNPVVLEPKSSGEGFIPIKLNTSKMEIIDIEELRKHIYEHEGSCDSTISIKHPHKELLTKVDILQVVTFFIPSGVA